MSNLRSDRPPSAVRISSAQTDPVIEFAKAELAQFWSAVSGPEDANLELSHFILELDASMEAGAFAVHSTPLAYGTEIMLTGPDSTCVLHAVYTFLEELGYSFQITGPVPPTKPVLQKMPSLHVNVRPAVLDRGIRQHINFPMDISGYPLAEAEEYIRNLARLRFNAITFHSYPGQWIDTTRGGRREYAGSFFYGQRHDIPDVPLLKRAIRNEKTFCIPDIEPAFDNEADRSAMATAWLRSLMAEAKRAGMKIRFSFEPRSLSPDTAETLTTANDILASYPAIDVLELMTEETGGWGEPLPVDELKAAIASQLGAGALEYGTIKPLLAPGRADLHSLTGQMAHNIRAAGDLLADGNTGIPEIAVGVYCAVPEYLPAVAEILHRHAPPRATFAILPGHGSERVSRHMRTMHPQPSDAARSTLYSWLEFDGIMYLQQNGVTGIRELLELAEKVNAPRQIPAVLFNHWRTAENEATARYASLATLHGPIDEIEFYNGFARGLGIEDAESLARALAAVDVADTVATELLPNIGFSFVGCWVRGIGLGYFANYAPAKIAMARCLYEDALALARQAAAGNASRSGQDYLAFFINRLDATVIYLEAMAEGVRLQPLCKDREPSTLTPQDQSAVLAICDRALALFDRYMEIHAAMMPDRGCEGTLLSVYHTPVAVLKKIRVWFGGLSADALPETAATKDAPVSPILFSS